MTKNKGINLLDDVLSSDLLSAIVHDFDRYGLAVKITGCGVEQITKYLEIKVWILLLTYLIYIQEVEL